MTCCTENAWGVLNNPEYKEKGIVDKIDDLDIYRVGESSKCIIWCYDVFGFKGGRTRQMCDFLADSGYMVIMPDFYRGEMCEPTEERIASFIKEKTQWQTSLKVDWEKKIRPYAEKHGAITFGGVGTCWGSYVVLRLAEDVCFKAGVSFHPSHSPIAGNILQESEEDILKAVKCPQMFMPAEGDHANTYPDGLGKKVMGDALSVVTFPDMKHGWSIRGDLSDPKVDRDVKKAFNLALGFFKIYM